MASSGPPDIQCHPVSCRYPGHVLCPAGGLHLLAPSQLQVSEILRQTYRVHRIILWMIIIFSGKVCILLNPRCISWFFSAWISSPLSNEEPCDLKEKLFFSSYNSQWLKLLLFYQRCSINGFLLVGVLHFATSGLTPENCPSRCWIEVRLKWVWMEGGQIPTPYNPPLLYTCVSSSCISYYSHKRYLLLFNTQSSIHKNTAFAMQWTSNNLLPISCTEVIIQNCLRNAPVILVWHVYLPWHRDIY